MPVFDRYMFKNLLVATVFIAVTLALIILLTQSLRFLELVIQSEASAGAFLTLTLLALPRFFEIILPIALMISTIFVYNKMTMDSELIVMRATGASPLRMARPALVLTALLTLLLLFITLWAGPKSMAQMQRLSQVIKAQYSTLLFQEGVFNAPIKGLTVFLRERARDGELHGLIIHDSRPENATPVTILAMRGVVVATPEGNQVVVYDGSRQALNPNTGALDRLNFERYTIALPDNAGPITQRWQEPNERTFLELFHPDPNNARDQESRRDFWIEAHRRIVTPLLAPAFVLMALMALLIGPVDRRGQGKRIALAVMGGVVIQSLYIGAYNMARHSNAGMVLMYLLVFVPLVAGGFVLSPAAEKFRQLWFYRRRLSGEETVA